MAGTEQAHRNATELVGAKLIMRAIIDRYGGSWDEHPLAEWPDAIVTEGGRPTFLYGGPNGGLCTYKLRPGAPLAREPWRSEPPSILVEGFVSDEIIETTAYAENGEVLGREVVAR